MKRHVSGLKCINHDSCHTSSAPFPPPLSAPKFSPLKPLFRSFPPLPLLPLDCSSSSICLMLLIGGRVICFIVSIKSREHSGRGERFQIQEKVPG
ncbi:hypothetical protein OPV22_018503 [Ensete ventricosum]|uniref:Uncharacterized protein n=1 Tax=Ensete ventricosum TaxID=4639 RepID=A0AAV8R4N4_ENSVE|nr:hypothetical protein OPV22_018503 [Ensete ventricosum]